LSPLFSATPQFYRYIQQPFYTLSSEYDYSCVILIVSHINEIVLSKPYSLQGISTE